MGIWTPIGSVCTGLAVAGGAATAVATDASVGGGGGLPQLDSGTFASQLFWLAVSFAILYTVMVKAVLPRIGDTLVERRRQIDDYLDAARQRSEEAETVRIAYEASLSDARKAAQQAMAEERDAIAAETARREAAFAKTMAAKTRESEARVAAVQREARATAKLVAIEAARRIIDRVAGVPAAGSAVDAAVTSALQHRSRSLI